MAQNKIALITGATAGIGEATAQILAKQCVNLIITGRRDEKLQNLKKSLEKNHGIVVKALSFDIRSYEETEKAWNSLDKKWHAIDYLINNAGLAAGLDYIHEGSLEDWNQMIDTNVKGLLNISRLVLPIMAERKTGHVINIGSIAG
ncbi:MAG TPA: SDR family NAD(P)-dependent oxidoreductase, partial [Salinivirgaceae bacterium]|nr:SDR family NAD(P)-dependent oxidoreductase [Salinivirgaceae bacterium]